MQFGRVDDHRISGVSYCGYHGSVPCSRCVCYRPFGIYCDVGLRSPDRLQTPIGCDGLVMVRPSVLCWSRDT